MNQLNLWLLGGANETRAGRQRVYILLREKGHCKVAFVMRSEVFCLFEATLNMTFSNENEKVEAYHNHQLMTVIHKI